MFTGYLRTISKMSEVLCTLRIVRTKMFRQDVVLLLIACLCFTGCASLESQANLSSGGFVTLASIETVEVASNEAEQQPDRLFQQTDRRIPLEGHTTMLAEVLADPVANMKLLSGFSNSDSDIVAVEIQSGRTASVIPIEMVKDDVGRIIVRSGSVIQLLTLEQWKNRPFVGFELRPDGKKISLQTGGKLVISGMVKTEGLLDLVSGTGGELKPNRIVEIANRNLRANGLKPDVVIVTRIRQNRVYKYFVPLTNESENVFINRVVQELSLIHI